MLDAPRNENVRLKRSRENSRNGINERKSSRKKEGRVSVEIRSGYSDLFNSNLARRTFGTPHLFVLFFKSQR